MRRSFGFCFLFHFFLGCHCSLEATNAFAEAFAEFGEFLGAKDKQRFVSFLNCGGWGRWLATQRPPRHTA